MVVAAERRAADVTTVVMHRLALVVARLEDLAARLEALEEREARREHRPAGYQLPAIDPESPHQALRQALESEAQANA